MSEELDRIIYALARMNIDNGYLYRDMMAAVLKLRAGEFYKALTSIDGVSESVSWQGWDGVRHEVRDVCHGNLVAIHELSLRIARSWANGYTLTRSTVEKMSV